jgi:hypothetical protein
MEITFKEIWYSWAYLAQIGVILLTPFPPRDNELLFTHDASDDLFGTPKTLIPQNRVDAPVSVNASVLFEDLLYSFPQSAILIGPVESVPLVEVTAFCHASGQKQSAQRVLVS